MSRKPAKTQHASTMKPERNNAPTAARQAGVMAGKVLKGAKAGRPSSSAADQIRAGHQSQDRHVVIWIFGSGRVKGSLIPDTIRSQSAPDSRDLMGRTATRRHLRDYDQSLQSIDTSRHKFSSFYLIGGCHQNASNFIGPQPGISLEKQSGDATHVRSGNRCTG
jgi:hypothetical protein